MINYQMVHLVIVQLTNHSPFKIHVMGCWLCKKNLLIGITKILLAFIYKLLKLTNNGCYVTITVTVTINKYHQLNKVVVLTKGSGGLDWYPYFASYRQRGREIWSTNVDNTSLPVCDEKPNIYQIWALIRQGFKSERVYLVWGVYLVPGGYLVGGGVCSEGCTWPGGSGGVPGPGGGGSWSRGVCSGGSLLWGVYLVRYCPPPVNRMNDRHM